MLAETKRDMVKHAAQIIVVCDHSKLNNTSLAQFVPAKQIDRLIIDRLPDNAVDILPALKNGDSCCVQTGA